MTAPTPCRASQLLALHKRTRAPAPILCRAALAAGSHARATLPQPVGPAQSDNSQAVVVCPYHAGPVGVAIRPLPWIALPGFHVFDRT